MTFWWERVPTVLARELAALDDAKIAHERDEEAWAAGILKLSLAFPWETGPVSLSATYPDLYPYFRPEVSSSDLRLTRHQNPITGNLCLINRPTSRWFAEDTLAGLLQENLRHLLRFRDTGDLAALAEVEEPQGEPVSEYYNYDAVPGSLVLFDGAWSIDPQHTRGRFRAALTEVGTVETVPVLRGCVTEVRATNGAILHRWEGPLPEGHRTYDGRWLRLSAAHLGDVHSLIDSLSPADRTYLEGQAHWPNTRAAVIAAVLFPEEVRQGHLADGWAFVEYVISRAKKGRPRTYGKVFMRSARAGATDLAARMPAVTALADKTVMVVGTGAVGGFVAVELARSGLGKLILMDGDAVEPANVRRWPLGWGAMGDQKVEALKVHLAAHYPWCEVTPFVEKVGTVYRPIEEPRQWGQLEELVTSADLVIDTSAELGVAHFLSDLTREKGKPFVVANATPGAWGGVVARFPHPNPSGCWLCLRHAMFGETPSIELPPADPQGEVQPPGCAEFTFTGTSFDLQEVSLEAVRVAAGLLSTDYPAPSWDVGVLALRDAEGNRRPPQWTGHHLARRPDCPVCGTHQ